MLKISGYEHAPSEIPAHPVPLTAEQAETMLQRHIKKHHVAIILLHWFNATTWLFELITGLALISSPHFRVAPLWFLTLLEGVFGSRANLLRFHIALGLTWVIVFLVYGIFGSRTYLSQEVLKKEIALDWDDFQWLRIRLLRILGRTTEELPPQGSYNAGQKLFAVAVYAMIPLVMFSGLIMAFHWFGSQVVAWAIVVHFVSVGLVVSGLMIHVYMGAVFPEEKAAFFSMLTGTVNELYAYDHHFKWWREVKMAERAWEAQRQETAAPASPHTVAENMQATPARSWFERAFRSPEYWPPYIAGTGLGLTLLATFVLMGTGLGASGGFTRYLTAFLPGLLPAMPPEIPIGAPTWSQANHRSSIFWCLN